MCMRFLIHMHFINDTLLRRWLMSPCRHNPEDPRSKAGRPGEPAGPMLWGRALPQARTSGEG